MGINKNKKIVFIHIPKCAGRSIEKALELTHMGHYSIHWYKNQKDLNNFIYFTCIRNPLDRAVSAFYYLNKGGRNKFDQIDYKKYIQKYNGNFNEFVKGEFQGNKPKILSQVHFKPQWPMIMDEKNKILVDYIIDFNNLKKDLNFFCKKYRILNKELQYHNLTKHDNFKLIYNSNPEALALIKTYYRKDIELYKKFKNKRNK